MFMVDEKIHYKSLWAVTCYNMLKLFAWWLHLQFVPSYRRNPSLGVFCMQVCAVCGYVCCMRVRVLYAGMCCMWVCVLYAGMCVVCGYVCCMLNKINSSYLFININQLDALNFIISLFHASTCFEHMCSLSGGQKFYFTVSGIITPIGVMIPHHTYRCDDTRDCIIQFLPSWRWAHVLETCRGMK